MGYQQCVLDGYEYEANPVENANPRVRAVVATETLGGRYFTDWGDDTSRRDIAQTWPTLSEEQFAALDAKAAAGGTLPYTDDDGTAYTVIAIPPTYRRKVPGGGAYIDVAFKLHVVSSP